MDAVCVKGDWSVVISYDKDDNLEGVLMYHIRKYRGFTFILMPMMTFYNGIYFHYRESIKVHRKTSFQHAVINKLLDQLPSYDLYYQQFSTAFDNWLPYYWRGYRQSTRYTYVIDRSDGEEQLWSALKGNVRRHINKAKELCVIEKTNFKDFWTALETSFVERNRPVPFDKNVLSRLIHAMTNEGSGELLLCKHKETGQVLAGNFIAYDSERSYYVCGFYNHKEKNIGGMSYLLWHNIINAKTRYFDFEGSMIKDIEFFFRTFGGKMTPHYKIWKVNNPLLRLILKFKKVDFLDQ